MRRFAVLVVCCLPLVGGATFVASASATTPAWFECAKAPKDAGEFENKTCTEPNAGGKGKFDLKAGIGSGAPFKGKGGAMSIHLLAWFGKEGCAGEQNSEPKGECWVSCKKSTVSGKDAMPNREEDVQIDFSRCSIFNATKTCQTPGAKAGEIKTKPLSGELGYIDESPVKVGLRLENEASPGGVITELECGEKGEDGPGDGGAYTKAKVFGALIGLQEGNINAATKERKLTYLRAEQYGEREYSEDGRSFKYKPDVNLLGWADELTEIEAAERPAHVLEAEQCSEWADRRFSEPHPECIAPEYVGLDTTLVNKGAALMVRT